MLTLGMSSLGFLVGLLISWSATPVVATALPLFFSVVGAIGGFYFGKIDVTTEKNQQKLTQMGTYLFALCLSCLVGVVFGSSTRPVVISFTSQLLQHDVSKSPDVVAAIVLRAKLQALGANKAEISAVLNAPINDSHVKIIESAIQLFSTASPRQISPNNSMIDLIANQPPLPPNLQRLFEQESNRGG